MRRVMLAAPLLLVVAACGSKQKVQTVTWTPQPAPAPAKAGAACKAAQLRIDRQGVTKPGAVLRSAGGTMIGGIALRNVVPQPCALADGITVRLEPALVLQTTPPAGGSRSAAATAWLGSLAGNREAWLSMQWANWCVKGKRPARLRIVLPQKGGSLTVAAPSVLPKCYEISAPTTVSVLAAPYLGLAPSRGGVVPLVAKVLPSAHAKAGAKLQARAGGVLRYRVELTSTADKPLPAATPACPLWAQQIVGGLPDVHVLGCASLGGLKPGHSVIYELQLKVPRLTQPGPHVLDWVLNPYSSQSPAARVPVTISAG